MKQITLTHGKFATVDDQDYYSLIKYKWVAANLYSDKFFARNQKHGLLHKFILRENPNEVFEVEFKNGDTLDCRRDNLIKKDSKLKNPNLELIKKSSQLGLFSNEEKVKNILSQNFSGVVEKIVYEAKYVSPDGRVFSFGTFDTPELAQENYDKMIKLIPKN